MIEPKSYENPRLKELIKILIDWINDELAPDRIIVKNIEEDMYDGMVLHKLIGLYFISIFFKITMKLHKNCL